MRFRLRSIFVCCVLASITCYWFTRPTQVADRFIATYPSNELPTEVVELLVKDSLFEHVTAYDSRLVSISKQRVTIAQLLLGQRHISATVWYKRGSGRFYYVVKYTASMSGIKAVKVEKSVTIF